MTDIPPVPFREAFWAWCKIATLSFGGPAGQIAVMHRILVEEKKWISEQRFLHALNFCMILPGPEAQQLMTYIGWLLHGVFGGIIAGTLFILPGFLSILALSILYTEFKEFWFVSALFYGLAPAVIAIVAHAVIRISKRALTRSSMIIVAAVSFIAIYFLKISFPLIILAAAIFGFLVAKLSKQDEQLNIESLNEDDRSKVKHSPKIAFIFLILWIIPIVVLYFSLGPDNIFVELSIFFSKASVVTFGGAYSVLVYVAQQAVDVHGWLKPGQMLDGLGMAETTPGPLIQVVQFVGYMGAYMKAEVTNLHGLSPLLAGTLASILVTWVTFIPCFLWIFLGAPFIERLRSSKLLSSSLSYVTAAVVGVILNLAIWFSIHTLFAKVKETKINGVYISIPELNSINVIPTIITLVALYLTFKLKVSIFRTLAICVFIGLLSHWADLAL